MGPYQFLDQARRVTLINEDGTPYTGGTGGGGSTVQAVTVASPSTLARVNSTAVEASHVLKTSAGNLLSLFGYNNGSAGFIQLFDSTTLPADGAAPVAAFAIAGTSNFSLDVAVLGLPFANGMAMCISSTLATKTIAAASLYITAIVK